MHYIFLKNIVPQRIIDQQVLYFLYLIFFEWIMERQYQYLCVDSGTSFLKFCPYCSFYFCILEFLQSWVHYKFSDFTRLSHPVTWICKYGIESLWISSIKIAGNQLCCHKCQKHLFSEHKWAVDSCFRATI